MFFSKRARSTRSSSSRCCADSLRWVLLLVMVSIFLRRPSPSAAATHSMSSVRKGSEDSDARSVTLAGVEIQDDSMFLSGAHGLRIARSHPRDRLLWKFDRVAVLYRQPIVPSPGRHAEHDFGSEI